MKNFVLILTASVTLIYSGFAVAAQDNRHSNSNELRIIKAEKRVLAGQAAIDKVSQLLELGRNTSEEKYYQQAYEILKSAQAQNSLPQIYQAEIEQYYHRFNEALALLNDAPDSAAVNMLRANILLTQGRVKQARGECKNLNNKVDRVVYMLCLAKVSGMDGELKRSLKLVKHIINSYKNISPEIRHWAYVTGAEMAERLKDNKLAKTYYAAALTLNKNDIATRIAYTDILLEEKNYSQVEAITRDYLDHDPLYLRYVRSLNIQGDLRTSSHFCGLKRRILAYTEDKAHLHYDTLAEYYYYFNQGQEQAMKWAVKHWQQQKTPRDARLLAKIAASQFNEPALHSITSWQVANNTEDMLLKNILTDVL